MKRIQKILMTLFLALSVFSTPLVVQAQNTAVCDGANFAGSGVNCKDKKLSDKKFSGIVSRIINIFSIAVGAVSVIMIIIGGFRYVLSAGESNAMSAAKNTILYAIVGLVIVLFAQIIVRFVLANVSK